MSVEREQTTTNPRAAGTGNRSVNVLLSSNRTYHTAQANMELLPSYYGWTYGGIRPYLAGTVIELGCGAGMGIASYLQCVERVIAVDFNDELLARVRERFSEAPVETRNVDLISGWQALGDVRVDAVLMMDVVEHFKDDGALVRNAAQLLTPGGYLCAKVPAGRSLYSDIDRASGHFRRYDRDDLVRLAEAGGLDLVSVSPINVLGALAYRLKSRKLRQSNFSSTFSANQLRAINLMIPVIRLFDVAHIFPGLSWIAVYRRI